MLCYALYTDGKWYRGLIKKYERNSERLLITVKYIDYGNSGVADISEYVYKKNYIFFIIKCLIIKILI